MHKRDKWTLCTLILSRSLRHQVCRALGYLRPKRERPWEIFIIIIYFVVLFLCFCALSSGLHVSTVAVAGILNCFFFFFIFFSSSRSQAGTVFPTVVLRPVLPLILEPDDIPIHPLHHAAVFHTGHWPTRHHRCTQAHFR